MSENQRIVLQKRINIIAMVVLGAYFTFHGLNASICHFKWPAEIELYFSVLLGTVALIRLFICRLYKNRSLWIAAFFALLCIVVRFTSREAFMLTLAFVAILLVGSDGSVLWKMAFWIQLITLLIAIICVQIGIIDDLIYMPEGVVRHSFGINYPTDFAAHLVMLVLLLWVGYKEVSNTEVVILAATLDFVVWRYCGAKCASVLLSAFILLVVYEMLFLKLKERKLFRLLDRVVFGLKLIFMPVMSVLSIYVTYIYDGTGFLEKINNLLTSRIFAGQMVLSRQGLSVFGQELIQMGSGGTVGTQAQYYFVDCSYLLAGIRCGVVVLIMLNVFYMVAVYRGQRCHSRRMMAAMVIIAMQAVVEQHLMEDWFNVFLLTALLRNLTDDSAVENLPKTHLKKHVAFWIGGVVLAVAAVLILPPVFTVLRTLVNYRHIAEVEDHLGYMVLIFVYMLLSGLTVSAGIMAIRQKHRHQKVDIRYLITCICGFVILTVSYAVAYHQAVKGTEEYDTVILAEKDTLSDLVSRFEGRIYVTDVPSLYRHYFGKVSNTMFTPELLDWQDDVIYIVPNGEENRVLIHDGYQYTQISAFHGIYTNSESAKAILASLGFEMADFCNARIYYPSWDILKYNPQVAVDVDGRAVISPEAPLQAGPYSLFYKGTMNVHMDLSFSDYDTAPDGIAAVIRIESPTDLVWLDYPVGTDEIGENGSFVLDLDQWIYLDIDQMQIKIIPQGETQIKINEISYQKISNGA